MAKLPPETLEAIWTLLKQLSRVVAEESASKYSQLANIRLRIAEAQPNAPADMLIFLHQGISQSQSRIPALERTLQEIKIEWNLP